MIEITLPYPPSVNRLWRAKKGGGVYRSAEYVNWKKAAAWELAVQVKSRSIQGRFKILIEAVAPDKRRRDIDNICKAILDVLVAARVIEDDHMCRDLHVRWVEGGPPVRIEIEGIEGGKEI